MPACSGWSPTTPTRSPARPTTAGWSSTSGSTRPRRRSRDGDDEPATDLRRAGPRGHERGEPDVQACPRPAHRPGHPQARPGPLRRLAGDRRGPRTIPRDRVEGWLTDTGRRRRRPSWGTDPAWYRLADPLFREIDTAGTHAPLLLVNVPPMEAVVARRAVARGLHAVRPLPGPRERRRGAPLGRGVRREAGRPAPRGGAPVPSRRASARPGPALFQVELRAAALDPGPCRRATFPSSPSTPTVPTSPPRLSPSDSASSRASRAPGLPEHLRLR